MPFTSLVAGDVFLTQTYPWDSFSICISFLRRRYRRRASGGARVNKEKMCVFPRPASRGDRYQMLKLWRLAFLQPCCKICHCFPGEPQAAVLAMEVYILSCVWRDTYCRLVPAFAQCSVHVSSASIVKVASYSAHSSQPLNAFVGQWSAWPARSKNLVARSNDKGCVVLFGQRIMFLLPLCYFLTYHWFQIFSVILLSCHWIVICNVI